MSEFYMKTLNCGHKKLIAHRLPHRLNHLCQVCAQKNLEKADRDFARAHFIGVLPSNRPVEEKALYFRRKFATI